MHNTSDKHKVFSEIEAGRLKCCWKGCVLFVEARRWDVRRGRTGARRRRLARRSRGLRRRRQGSNRFAVHAHSSVEELVLLDGLNEATPLLAQLAKNGHGREMATVFLDVVHAIVNTGENTSSAKASLIVNQNRVLGGCVSIMELTQQPKHGRRRAWGLVSSWPAKEKVCHSADVVCLCVGDLEERSVAVLKLERLQILDLERPKRQLLRDLRPVLRTDVRCRQHDNALALALPDELPETSQRRHFAALCAVERVLCDDVARVAANTGHAICVDVPINRALILAAKLYARGLGGKMIDQAVVRCKQVHGLLVDLRQPRVEAEKLALNGRDRLRHSPIGCSRDDGRARRRDVHQVEETRGPILLLIFLIQQIFQLACRGPAKVIVCSQLSLELAGKAALLLLMQLLLLESLLLLSRLVGLLASHQGCHPALAILAALHVGEEIIDGIHKRALEQLLHHAGGRTRHGRRDEAPLLSAVTSRELSPLRLHTKRLYNIVAIRRPVRLGRAVLLSAIEQILPLPVGPADRPETAGAAGREGAARIVNLNSCLALGLADLVVVRRPPEEPHADGNKHKQRKHKQRRVPVLVPRCHRLLCL
eukprot:m.50864 g.50864  ORF g.50864 m.50864 type:complete len:594 (-) comp6574_c0_seq1:136-1917(-)